MTAAFTPFSDLLASRVRDGDSVAFTVPDDWLQGRTAFGGLIASLAVQAMRDVAGAAWPPPVRLRALQTNFIGPVAAGPVEVAVRLLREGKSVRQVQASVTSQGQCAALLVGVYGGPRATAVPPLVPQQRVLRLSAESAPTQPFVAGKMVSFLQHFVLAWADGHPPYSGGQGWETSFYLRLVNDRADEVDRDVLTVLLADAPPSPAISLLTSFAPASSVCWALELLPLDAPAGADDWWRLDSHARSADSGYVNHSSTLWAATGEAAAIGHQLVTVYG